MSSLSEASLRSAYERLSTKEEQEMGNLIKIEKIGYGWEKLFWVLSARSLDESTHRDMNMRNLKVEKGIFIATDGRRLHAWDSRVGGDEFSELMPDGLYEIVSAKRNKKDPLILQAIEGMTDFPNCRAICPCQGYWGFVTVDKYDTDFAYTRIVRAMADNDTLPYTQVQDMLCGDESEWIVSVFSENTAVQFQSNDCFGLIMPKHIE